MTRARNPHVPASVHTNRLDSGTSVHFGFNISGECEILPARFIISCPCNFYCFFQILSIYVLFICIFLYICHCLRVPSIALSICPWCRPHSVLKHFSFFFIAFFFWWGNLACNMKAFWPSRLSNFFFSGHYHNSRLDFGVAFSILC